MGKEDVKVACLELQQTRLGPVTRCLDMSKRLYSRCRDLPKERTCLAAYLAESFVQEHLEGRKANAADGDRFAFAKMMAEKKLTVSVQKSENDEVSLVLLERGEGNEQNRMALGDAFALAKTENSLASTTQDTDPVPRNNGGTARDRNESASTTGVAQPGKRRKRKQMASARCSGTKKRGSAGRAPAAQVPRKMARHRRSSLGASATHMLVSDDSSDEDDAARGGNPQGADDGTRRGRRRKERHSQAENPLGSTSETDPLGGCTETTGQAENPLETAEAGMSGSDDSSVRKPQSTTADGREGAPETDPLGVHSESAQRGVTAAQAAAANHLLDMKHHGQGGASETGPLGVLFSATAQRRATTAQAGRFDEFDFEGHAVQVSEHPAADVFETGPRGAAQAFEDHAAQVSEHPAADAATNPPPQPMSVDGNNDPSETAPALGVSGSDVATAPPPQPATLDGHDDPFETAPAAVSESDDSTAPPSDARQGLVVLRPAPHPCCWLLSSPFAMGMSAFWLLLQ